MNIPCDKYLLQDYRDDMRSPDAPQFLDTQKELLPVKTIGAGLPKPNSKQRVRYAQIRVDATNRTSQISTVSPTQNVYLLGVITQTDTGVTLGGTVFDASSGSYSSPSAGTPLIDENSWIIQHTTPATAFTILQTFLSFPLKLKNGIRCTYGGAGQSGYIAIYYIEEIN